MTSPRKALYRLGTDDGYYLHQLMQLFEFHFARNGRRPDQGKSPNDWRDTKLRLVMLHK
jgi:hypothetical protein